MDTPWNAYMQVGLVHFMMYPEAMAGEDNALQSIEKLAADPFFEVLEITRIKNPEVRQQVRQVADTAHIDLGFGAQPPVLMNKLNTAALDEAARQAAVADIKLSIDQAYEHGCRLLAMIDGLESWPGEERKEQALEQVTRSLTELTAYAEQQARDYLLTISLETFDRAIEKKSLLGPTRDAVEVARRVRERHPNFGLTIDLSHIPLLKESIRDCLVQASDVLIHTHIGNCQMRDPSLPSYGDKHPRFGAPLGENDTEALAEFLTVLFEIGYFQKQVPTRRPVVTFEVRPLPGERQDLLIANCRRVLEDAWAKVSPKS
ncbi:MAG TPA: TIM barrel protein [Chloroflexota bacterium]|nr:TIM barrel protein [Chloroflexota bacterium]